MSDGNTTGRVVGQPPAPVVPAAKANPPAQPTPEEKGVLEKFKDGVDKGIDDWVEGQGDSKLAMAGGALAKAASAVFLPSAWWELVPVGKAFKLAKKGGEAVGILKKTDKAADAAKEAARLKKLEEEAARLKKLEEEAAAAKKAQDGAKVKPKKRLKCGEYGKYGELKKKNGDGKFDRDHIPSKAALKEKALELNGGVPLTAAQKSAIDKWGGSIAVPRQAHIDVSPTHGTKNIDLAPKDAQNLAGAARRDVEEMLKKIDDYDADGGCKKAYQKSAKRVLKMNNKEFDDALSGILSKVK